MEKTTLIWSRTGGDTLRNSEQTVMAYMPQHCDMPIWYMWLWCYVEFSRRIYFLTSCWHGYQSCMKWHKDSLSTRPRCYQTIWLRKSQSTSQWRPKGNLPLSICRHTLWMPFVLWLLYLLWVGFGPRPMSIPYISITPRCGRIKPEISSMKYVIM